MKILIFQKMINQTFITTTSVIVLFALYSCSTDSNTIAHRSRDIYLNPGTTAVIDVSDLIANSYTDFHTVLKPTHGDITLDRSTLRYIPHQGLSEFKDKLVLNVMSNGNRIQVETINIYVANKATQLFGIDVSQYNGTVDWLKVKEDGKVFAYARASDGYLTDNLFQVNMKNGSNARMVMGAYHFAEPSAGDGAAQARHFLNVARAYIGNKYLPPVLDLETSGGVAYATLVQFANDWLSEVQRETGVMPIIYTSLPFARSYLNSSFSTYNLWLARWDGNTNPTSTLNLVFWSKWIFKQYSGTGIVPGAAGSVGLDVFSGDAVALKKLLHASDDEEEIDKYE